MRLRRASDATRPAMLETIRQAKLEADVEASQRYCTVACPKSPVIRNAHD